MRGREYLQSHRIHLPLIADPQGFQRNSIPGTPYAVVTDLANAILVAGGVNSLEQIEYLVRSACAVSQGSEALEDLSSVEVRTPK